MEKGCVCEAGNHEELMIKNGVYAGLVKEQNILENYNGNRRKKADNQKMPDNYPASDKAAGLHNRVSES